MTSRIDKYANRFKANKLYSCAMSNNGGGGDGGDEAFGLRCKSKAEATLNRRSMVEATFKRQSLTNRNRYDVGLYDELMVMVVDTGKKLTLQPTPQSLKITHRGVGVPCGLSRADTIATTNRKRLTEEAARRKRSDETSANVKRPMFKVCSVDARTYSTLTPKTTLLPTAKQQTTTPQNKFKVREGERIIF